jgi:hypothetical protein
MKDPLAEELSVKILCLMATIIMLASCQTTTPPSAVKITHGVAIPEARYPSVVLLAMRVGDGLTATCTATFVNHHQALTAAHCLGQLDPKQPDIYHAVPEEKGLRRLTKALSFAVHPKSDKKSVNMYDLAVVNFPLETAPAVSPIIDRQPREKEKVLLVGYGEFEAGAGAKRYGKNEIAAFQEELITIAGVPGETEGMQSPAFGDAGGPLFIQEMLTGVTSGGNVVSNEEGAEVISNFVNLAHPESVAFLKSQGIKVSVR